MSFVGITQMYRDVYVTPNW